jgi:signal transduction histidine kinase
MQITIDSVNLLERPIVDISQSDWAKALSNESKRIQEFMLLCAVIIFPLFAFFDQYTLPSEHFVTATAIRFAITLTIGIGLYFQKSKDLNHIYLSYYSLLSISIFCTYATFIGGVDHLYEHNLATCTVFLASSIFFIWHWQHSVTVVGIVVAVYLFGLQVTSITFKQLMISGGSVLMSIMAIFPVVVAYKYHSFKMEFLLKKELEESNQALRQEKTETEIKNQELSKARTSLDHANKELQVVNTSLEKIVKERTQNLETSNADLRQILEELDMFLYSSYHDLKGPVSRLMGLANLAKVEVKENVAHFYIDKFMENIQEMQILMKKLNNVHHINIKDVVAENVSFPVLVDDLMKKYKLQLSTIKFNHEIKGETDFHSDSEMIRFALERILENALIFRKNNLDEDNINLAISITPDNVRISLFDNGIGIPEQILEQIFKMFYRGHEISKGHGLGLYTAKKACEKIKGSIKVISVENMFTEVILLLPNKRPK